jgi:carbamoyl-phosphate synthase large subunit
VPLAKAAAQISLGKTVALLREEGLLPESGDGLARGISVKEAVLPWNRFKKRDGSGVDALLGPEMRSTGEVMGRDDTFGMAFSKSQSAAAGALPNSGGVFVSFADRDKPEGLLGAKKLFDAGYELYATSGTAKALRDQGVSVNVVRKFSEGKGREGESTALDLIESGTVALVVNTSFGAGPRVDGWRIRTSAVARGIPIITTISGLNAAAEAMVAQRTGNFTATSLQEWLR